MAENKIVIKLHPEQMKHLETAFMTALVEVEAELDEARQERDAWRELWLQEVLLVSNKNCPECGHPTLVHSEFIGCAYRGIHNELLCQCELTPKKIKKALKRQAKTTTQTEFTILFSKQLSEGVSANFQAALANLLGCYDPGWLLTCRDVKFDADGEEVCDAEAQT